MINFNADSSGFKNLKARLKAVMYEIFHRTIKTLAKKIRNNIPKTKWLARYKSALTVYPVVRNPFVLVISAELKANVKDLDPAETVFYITGPSSTRWQKAADILKEHSPWAMSALPRVKGGLPVNGFVRIVRRTEVQQALTKNNAKIEDIRLALNDAGLQLDQTTPIKLTGKVLYDLGFMILRAEYGIATKKMAHWRPALKWLEQGGMAEILGSGGNEAISKIFRGPVGKSIAIVKKVGHKPWDLKRVITLKKFSKMILSNTIQAALNKGKGSFGQDRGSASY